MTDLIRSRILEWYRLHKRDLPWRDTGNAYFVWLSEIIMQQTRVEQGTPYFLRFREKFPTVADLAYAHQDEVLKLWQGLGYYSRARNLHATAHQIMENFDGKFPETYDQIIQLKGIGPYTAAAIASIVFDEPKAVVDGNVTRVIARIFGIKDAVNTTAISKQIQILAEELLDVKHPGDFNQAMMEFGALQCTPKNPDCQNCPAFEFCAARQQNLVDQIPAKEKKLKRRSRYFHFLMVENKGQILIEQRGSGDIWEGLFQFPLIETENERTLDEAAIARFLGAKCELKEVFVEKKHVLSHQDLWARFYRVSADVANVLNYKAVKREELHTFALPRLIDRFLESFE